MKFFPVIRYNLFLKKKEYYDAVLSDLQKEISLLRETEEKIWEIRNFLYSNKELYNSFDKLSQGIINSLSNQKSTLRKKERKIEKKIGKCILKLQNLKK